MKTEPRNRLVYVGKLDQCTSEDLINHLKAIDVKAISCIPFTKSIFNKKSSTYNNNNNTNNNSSQTNETKTSAAFRIMYLETDFDKVMNEDNWPGGVILHEWCSFDIRFITEVFTIKCLNLIPSFKCASLICVSETWLSTTNDKLINLPGIACGVMWMHHSDWYLNHVPLLADPEFHGGKDDF
ncbi:hypothetical protein HELRODRAFT_171274 [Helobdella robusta]|uniref:Uncharacterized protein n=1 Tax=Helobdella robusta TaxID=6412 RepID=T1F407_HELRO|nr:hypothetical protein HELRODRAFT_171274 [Helobdella robusta]ESO05620.1 hypothetical protein HELRODRAFT_171274 [Helobdella robusta]